MKIFRKAGLPIGSGVIEAVAKCTKQRMSGSGMRWSRSGATNLLPFHSAELSGSFDRFWARVCPKPGCTRFKFAGHIPIKFAQCFGRVYVIKRFGIGAQLNLRIVLQPLRKVRLQLRVIGERSIQRVVIHHPGCIKARLKFGWHCKRVVWFHDLGG